MSINQGNLIEAATSSPAAGRRRRRRLHVPVIIAAVVFAFLLVAALFPGVLTSYDPLATDMSASRQPPSAEHLFGTDTLGRDVFARVVHGARISLTFGFSATLIALASAIVLGIATGLAPDWVDNIVMRILEILLALPEILVALVIIAMLGKGQANLVLAITIAAIPFYTRAVRIATRQVRRSEFVEAAVGMGQKRGTIIVRHILPNVIGPVLVLGTIGIGGAIISASGLSFLGLGPASPTPEWGLMLSDGRGSLATAWWMAVFPGLAITVTVISTTVLGRFLQARFEGRQA